MKGDQWPVFRSLRHVGADCLKQSAFDSAKRKNAPIPSDCLKQSVILWRRDDIVATAISLAVRAAELINSESTSKPSVRDSSRFPSSDV